jgi:hypothetical protein
MEIRTPIFALAFAATFASTAMADTSVATKWRLIGQAQNDCMTHAESALMNAGFDRADPGTQTMSGKHGDYTASIRCVSELNMVFFVMTGPSPATAAQYLEVLYGRF